MNFIPPALPAASAGHAPQRLPRAHDRPHPNLITKWKRQTAEGMVEVFSGKAGGRDKIHEAEIKELHANIGELTVERDFLSRAFGR